jgi:hypothetical protein
MDNRTRSQIVADAKAQGYQGSYVDLFRQAEAQPLTASTPSEQSEGLRPAHAAGNTQASMEFPNTPPNTEFNTQGMKAPIDIKKYDDVGNLVKSYDSVPPGITGIDTGPGNGTVIESPARRQLGGARAGEKKTEERPQPEDVIMWNPETNSEDTVRMDTSEGAIFDRGHQSDTLDMQSILKRQAWAESSGRSDAVSPAGARGLTQIMPVTEEEGKRLGFADDDFDPLDPVQAVQFQKDYMNYGLERPYVDHKENKSETVTMAKALAWYNMGNQLRLTLNKIKEGGGDIYSLDWVDSPDIPKETRDYIKRILLKGDKDFNSSYENNSDMLDEYYD